MVWTYGTGRFRVCVHRWACLRRLCYSTIDRRQYRIWDPTELEIRRAARAANRTRSSLPCRRGTIGLVLGCRVASASASLLQGQSSQIVPFIFDEATSALDTHSERLVQGRGRWAAVLVIAHRVDVPSFGRIVRPCLSFRGGRALSAPLRASALGPACQCQRLGLVELSGNCWPATLGPGACERPAPDRVLDFSSPFLESGRASGASRVRPVQRTRVVCRCGVAGPSS